MKIVPVSPEDFPDVRDSRRGRVSYPIVKMFLESTDEEGNPTVLAKLDRDGMQQSLQGLTSAVGSYIRNRDLPIRLFTRGGEIYLMRKDLNRDGTPDQEWVDEHKPLTETDPDSLPTISAETASQKVKSGTHGS
jgi:hypothetical protein